MTKRPRKYERKGKAENEARLGGFQGGSLDGGSSKRGGRASARSKWQDCELGAGLALQRSPRCLTKSHFSLFSE